MTHVESTAEPSPGEITIPLNSLQKRLFSFRNGAFRTVSQQHDPMVLVIDGNIDINFFWNVIGEIVERHDALRTSFKEVDGQPVQVIHDNVHFSIDYRKAGKEDMDDIVRGLSFEFDLSKAPLFRIYLVRIKAHRHVLIFDMHHLIADEISRNIIVGEIIKRYNGDILPDQAINYRDYLSWHQKESFKQSLKAQKQYWMERFSGTLPVLNLPTDFARPAHQDFKAEAISVIVENIALEKLTKLRILATHNLDFTETAKIDNRLKRLTSELSEIPAGFTTIKLAMLASSTNEHLPPGIRVGALRRGILADIYVAPYGQYTQELLNPDSDCRRYQPDAVLLAVNYHDIPLNKLPLTADRAAVEALVEEVIRGWTRLWEIITNQLNAVVIQHTLVTPPEQCFGEYDLLLPASPGNVVNRINLALAEKAVEHKALLLNMDALAATVGKNNWCDDGLWDYGKQDVSPLQIALYGDRVARILAAVRGQSKKCLVLDLDNTL